MACATLKTSLLIRPQISSDVKGHLDASGVVVVDYARLVPDVCSLAASGNTLWLDPGKVSYAIFQAASNAREEAEKGENVVIEEARRNWMGQAACFACEVV